MEYKTFHRFSRIFYWATVIYFLAFLFGGVLYNVFLESDFDAPISPGQWSPEKLEEQKAAKELYFQTKDLVVSTLGVLLMYMTGAGFIIAGIGGLKFKVLSIRRFLASPTTVALLPEEIRHSFWVKLGSIACILIGLYLIWYTSDLAIMHFSQIL